MSTVFDVFPPPSLDSNKWSSTLVGSVGLSVGVPSNGVYPLTVDDPGDQVRIDSEGKISTPSGSFDVRLFYADVFSDLDENIVSFLGWRSTQKDGLGDPAYGIDALLCVKPDPVYEFQKRAINLGSVGRSTVLIDPTSGADGGFRIVRSGTDYQLYYYNSGWVLFETEALPHNGPGYIVFGQFAESPTLLAFPWIPQT